jgi:hypothetical protein
MIAVTAVRVATALLVGNAGAAMVVLPEPVVSASPANAVRGRAGKAGSGTIGGMIAASPWNRWCRCRS